MPTQPVVVCVEQLPAPIARQCERMIADQQKLAIEMDTLAAEIARRPDDRKLQEKWSSRLQRLADLTAVLELFEKPIVRLVSSECQRQRREAQTAARMS